MFITLYRILSYIFIVGCTYLCFIYRTYFVYELFSYQSLALDNPHFISYPLHGDAVVQNDIRSCFFCLHFQQQLYDLAHPFGRWRGVIFSFRVVISSTGTGLDCRTTINLTRIPARFKWFENFAFMTLQKAL